MDHYLRADIHPAEGMCMEQEDMLHLRVHQIKVTSARWFI